MDYAFLRGGGTMAMIQYIFDLDGTLTCAETLPLVAQHFHLDVAMAHMTRQAIYGHIPFEQSLRERVHMLGHLPVDGVAQLLATVPLYGKILEFIGENVSHCCVATANMDVWLTQLAKKIPCKIHCSTAHVQDNRITGLAHILQKDVLVQKYAAQGHRVVFIGDGHNDVPALDCAHVAIGAAMTHALAPSVQKVVQHVASTEEELYTLLCAQLSKTKA